jgi:CBS domain-containing protein
LDAIDPVAYVRATPPFDALPAPLFEGAARALEVGFHPAGTTLARAGGTPLDRLFVIRRGSVRLERDGQLVQVLEEGETFGYTSLITRQATLDVFVDEDLLSYELPDARFQALRAADAPFAGHFAVGLAERLKNSLAHSPVVQFRPDLAQDVAGLARRAPVWIRPEASVGEAARLMRAEGISSVLVRTDPPGIVTDRDLADRVLADGLGPDAPLAPLAGRPLRAVAAGTPLHEAWSVLLDSGAHHLAVTRRGEIVGMVSANDLLKASAHGPVAVLRRVERLPSRAALPGYSEKVAEMDAALLAGGLDALAVAEVVARLNDALLARIVGWAEADLGPAPAPWAWIAFGSEARREQALLTDQDDALVYADAGAGEGAWFEAFAERVNADLEAAGFPPCPMGHMARRSHGTLSAWAARFDDCIDERRPHAASLLFDFRKVAGALDLERLEAAVGRAERNPAVLRFLARAAIEHRPPAGLALRGHAEVDLKAHGIVPIVSLARCYGLEVGGGPRSTLARLDAACRRGLLSEPGREAVAQAFRFLAGLRLRRELRLLSERRAPSPVVRLGELSAIERSRLKESLRQIRRWQDRAAYHYRADFF